MILNLVDNEPDKHEVYDYYWALITNPEDYKGSKPGPWGDQDRCIITDMGKMVEGKYIQKVYKIKTQTCDGKKWQDRKILVRTQRE